LNQVLFGMTVHHPVTFCIRKLDRKGLQLFPDFARRSG
jgi:hypothetical protein